MEGKVEEGPEMVKPRREGRMCVWNAVKVEHVEEILGTMLAYRSWRGKASLPTEKIGRQKTYDDKCSGNNLPDDCRCEILSLGDKVHGFGKNDDSLAKNN